MFKKISLFMVLIMTVFAFAGCNGEKSKTQKEELSPEEIKYNEAMEYIEDGKYTAALDIITELGDYKDCKDLREKFIFKCSKAIDDYSETIYTYDDKGNQLTYELISDELPWEKTTYTYNDKNQCVEEIEEGYLYRVAKHTYDAKGNRILTEFDNNGRIEYEYDDNNNCIKEHEFYGEPYTGEHITTYTYDSNNNCIEKVEEDGIKIISTTSYTYDADGKLVREEQGIAYGSYEDIEYTYDDGCCIEKRLSTPNWNAFFRYEYDKYNNVIRSDYASFDAYSVDDITYYEYVLFYDGKLANDYVQPTIAKDDLTDEKIVEVTRKNLGVPDNDAITYDIGEKYYDIAKALYYVYVAFYEESEIVAGANVNIKTGELVSSIIGYDENR